MSQNIRQTQTSRYHYATLTSSANSKNQSTGIKSSAKLSRKLIKINPPKLSSQKISKKQPKSKNTIQGNQSGIRKAIINLAKPSPTTINFMKKSKNRNGLHTANNSRKKQPIDSLVSKTLRQYSTQKLRIKQSERDLAHSRKLQAQQLRQFQRQTRERNLRLFPPSEDNQLSERLPWGANETRIKKHVIQIIEKLGKIRQSSRSSSKSQSNKKRSRRQIGTEFLNRMSPQRVKGLVLKSQRSSKDLRSIEMQKSERGRDRSSHDRKLKTEMSNKRLGVIGAFVGEEERVVLPLIKSSKRLKTQTIKVKVYKNEMK